ncbi:MAG: DUF4136 domain-containing protein [Odoribacter sp.]
MKRLLFLLLAGLFAQLIVSCYPEGADNIKDYDVAITNYDKSADFGTFSTFSIPDSIVYFSNDKEAAPSHQFDSIIIKQVTKHFADRGYTQIDNPTSEEDEIPSFVVAISAFSNVNYSYFVDNWYNNWNWYWGSWWGNSFSPYYPWYPVSVYSYRTGSVTIEMISTAERSDDKLNVVWTGIADGLLQGSNSFILSRINSQLDQCFTQSPYLKK